LRHLRSADRIWLVALIAAWGVCFALSAGSVWRGDALSPLYVEPGPGPDALPRLVGFRPWIAEEPVEIESGDELLRLGSLDLSGVGTYGFWVRVPEVAGDRGWIELTYARGERVGAVRLPVGSHRLLWPYLVVSLAFAATGVILMLRTRTTPTIRALSLATLVLAVNWASNFAGSREQAWLSLAVHAGSMCLAVPLALRGVARFPEDAPPLSSRAWNALWLFAGVGVLEAGRFNWGWFLSPEAGRVLFLGGEVLGFAVALALLTRNWRHTDAIGRRQLRWLVLGWYLAVAPVVACAALAVVRPETVPVYVASQMALALIPLSLFVATIRYNWFDIDRLLSATASYNAVCILALGIMLVIVPRAAEATAHWTGFGTTASNALLALLAAAGAMVVCRRLRPWIEHSFFPERYAFDLGVDELLADLRSWASPRELTERIGERLHRLLQPEVTVVYARLGSGFSPVYVRGRAVPPAFESDTPLISALGEGQEAIALSDRGRRTAVLPVGTFERAALHTLDAAVLVPFRREERLMAFLCLGPKRSGDVYTSTDLARLSLLAGNVSARLRLFDLEEIGRQGRAMQESLRRYVPGAVAAQLAAGRDPGSGRRELSVLFVDLRGYTSYAESRAAEEIFSTVNRYTQAVSRVVGDHGGSVVEFNGDGMMAVFGAPEPLAEKERAAVAAAREIVHEVGTLGAMARGPGEAGLSVAVGVATGETFVGNIQGADRLIWAAIGNTTNLAARLQSLARDLGAAVVVDSRTWARAGATAAGFDRKEGVRVRGRSDPVDVHTLPLAPSGPGSSPRGPPGGAGPCEPVHREGEPGGAILRR